MDIISALIHEGIAKNTFNAAAIANGLKFPELPDDESRLARARLYREWRHAGENVQAAFGRAIRGEEAPKEFEIKPEPVRYEYYCRGRYVKVTDMQNGKFVYETDRGESGYVTSLTLQNAMGMIEDHIKDIDEMPVNILEEHEL
jgi:hypothetical protein